MIAAIQIFLTINILLLADVFSIVSEFGKEGILQSVEKQIILNDIHKRYSESMFQSLDEQAKHSNILVLKMVPATLEQVLASLFDRYAAIHMNIMCWTCSVYFWTASVKTIDDLEKAEKCQKVGKLLSKYNDIFTGQMFIDAYDNARSIKNKANGMNMFQIAEDIDKVTKNLKIINDLFVEYKLDFDAIFKKLENNIQNCEKDETGELVSFRIIWLKLWHYLSRDFLNINNYMRSLVGLTLSVHNWEQLIESIEIYKIIWAHILEVADDAGDGYVKMAQEISSLKERRFKAKIETENIDIPEGFGKRRWTIERVKGKERFSDFEIQLKRDTNVH